MPIDVYPVCALRWESRPGDIRGVSAVLPMIPNQIEVNKTVARRAIAVKRYSYPSIAYDKKKIVNVDDLSKVGSNIAIDNMGQNPIGSIIQYLSPAPISADAQMLQNELMSVTRLLEGAGDAALGQVDPTKASGEAIKAARDQAAIPLNEQYAAYKQFVEDVAIVWHKLWTAYSPKGLEISYVENGERRTVFIGQKELLGLEASIKIEVSPIDPYSRLSQEVALEWLLTMGMISFDEYVGALSDDSSVPRGKLMLILKERERAAQAAVDVDTDTEIEGETDAKTPGI